MNKRNGYKWKVLAGAEELDSKVEQCLISAFRKGYSVCEIARVSKMRSAKYVHRALVKAGVLLAAKSGKLPKELVIPTDLAKCLKYYDLSFAQWCAGWGLDHKEALAGLQDGTGGVLRAIMRDFPQYHEKLTGIKKESFSNAPQAPQNKFSVTFDWDGINSCFTAEIPEMGIMAYGTSHAAALYHVSIQRRQLLAIEYLEQLPRLDGLEEKDFDW